MSGMSTAQATDSAVQLRARRISALIMTAGVLGAPSLGVIAGRIFSAGDISIFVVPGPILFLRWVTPFVVFTAPPFVGLAVLTRRSVCKQGRLSAFWIGAFVGGLVVSILVFAILASDLEFLWNCWAGLKWSGVIFAGAAHSVTMLLGGAIGWILARAISWLRQRAA